MCKCGLKFSSRTRMKAIHVRSRMSEHPCTHLLNVNIINEYYFLVFLTGHAAVVSDVKECADIGLELIKKGGSAVDAAIGSMLCVGVMNPESSGLGGYVDTQQLHYIVPFQEISIPPSPM